MSKFVHFINELTRNLMNGVCHQDHLTCDIWEIEWKLTIILGSRLFLEVNLIEIKASVTLFAHCCLFLTIL